MITYYGSVLSPNQLETAEGYLVCRNVPIARTGEQEYLAGEFGLEGDPDNRITITRRPDDVFAEAAIASFEGKPVTDGHPPEDVRAENYSAYAKGHLQNVRRSGDTLMGDIYINDATLASDVRNNVKREISCGYHCTLVPNGSGYYQTNIRGNHVAVVPLGRAGHDVAIHDAATTAEKGRLTTMSKFMEKFLTAFGEAAKETDSSETANMAGIMATALDAEPAEQAQDAEPATPPAAEKAEEKTEDEGIPRGDDLGAKLDRIIQMLEAKGRGGRGEHPLHDETDLDELVEKLSGEGDGESKLLEANDSGDCKPANDTAELLRRVRPAVAAIKDKAERARVVDALIGAVSNDSVYSSINAAAKDSATAAAAAKTTSYEQACEESQNAYNARNPHRSKEG